MSSRLPVLLPTLALLAATPALADGRLDMSGAPGRKRRPLSPPVHFRATREFSHTLTSRYRGGIIA